MPFLREYNYVFLLVVQFKDHGYSAKHVSVSRSNRQQQSTHVFSNRNLRIWRKSPLHLQCYFESCYRLRKTVYPQFGYQLLQRESMCMPDSTFVELPLSQSSCFYIDVYVYAYIQIDMLMCVYVDIRYKCTTRLYV